ncbi:hypothetical protein EXIGLDRAFT_696716 [Exidia glandulosa HHB12029]|uniref:Rapamycin-insensitive companion of mTOR N-terminal domain-containing protein n=1 Tax=Exidia glandulosa HHB12029 TaxID=1314781 RepID=A0A165N2B3_EXIGL|nr:hypothetical protein EXIGLDRAFT_696716 [Exidia glandulosa HHB12029]
MTALRMPEVRQDCSIRTNHADPTINLTKPYVDLTPFYDCSDEAQEGVRRRYHIENPNHNVRSSPYAYFALTRPSVHRRQAPQDQLAGVKGLALVPSSTRRFPERGPVEDEWQMRHGSGCEHACARYARSDGELTEEDICARLNAQVGEIFNTAKLVNVAWFAMIVFSDYFSAILGLMPNDSSWTLDLFAEIRNEDHAMRRSIVSQSDEAWTEGIFKKIFGDKKPFSEITPEDFIMAMRKMKEHEDPDMSTWTIGRLQRGPDDRYNDDGLARILQDACENPAAAFGARGTPEVLRIVDVLGIMQIRRWGVCTLNDFRQAAAYGPYGHNDNLELYVGLQAGEAKPVVDREGLRPGYTMSRAILADMSSVVCDLLLRTLPKNYTYNSTDTWFSLMTPKAMKVLTDLEVADRYGFSLPSAHPTVVTTYDAVQKGVQNADMAFIADALLGNDGIVGAALWYGRQMNKALIEERPYKFVGELKEQSAPSRTLHKTRSANNLGAGSPGQPGSRSNQGSTLAMSFPITPSSTEAELGHARAETMDLLVAALQSNVRAAYELTSSPQSLDDLVGAIVPCLLHEFGIDCYLVRSLARDSKHSVEKEHAMRLIRTVVELGCRRCKMALPSSFTLPSDAVTRALVSIAEHPEDVFRLVAIETLAEMKQEHKSSNGVPVRWTYDSEDLAAAAGDDPDTSLTSLSYDVREGVAK